MPVVMKNFLIKNGCNPQNFEYIKAGAFDYIFKHKASNKKVYFRY